MPGCFWSEPSTALGWCRFGRCSRITSSGSSWQIRCFVGVKFEKLAQQLLLGVGVSRVFGNAFYRAHHHTLRLIEMPHALGAFAWVYFINFFTHADRAVRALGLAHVTVNAFVGDD